MFDLLTFNTGYFSRVWGGDALRTQLGMDAPEAPVGEAWLLADHPAHESRVAKGPFEGSTLQDLMALNDLALLGTLPKRTRDGRFPLMLKLLDCNDVLSVQIHPDDALAEELGERDGGKTEMWYFVDAAPGAEIICGLVEGTSEEDLARAAREGGMAELMKRWPVRPGDAALVRAGTVHALGAGLLAAEIQQTSDVTYRLYDWDRMGTDGQPRQLHIEQALRCAALNTAFDGLAEPTELTAVDAKRELLATSEFFAAERVSLKGKLHIYETGGESFRVLLCVAGKIKLQSGDGECKLTPGQCALLAGVQECYVAEGTGVMLDYYVPSGG